jgi:hypothetical protein
MTRKRLFIERRSRNVNPIGFPEEEEEEDDIKEYFDRLRRTRKKNVL